MDVFDPYHLCIRAVLLTQLEQQHRAKTREIWRMKFVREVDTARYRRLVGDVHRLHNRIVEMREDLYGYAKQSGASA